jgi:hypothetical protein
MKNLMPLLLKLMLILAFVPRAALAQQQLTDPAVVKIKTDIDRRLRDGKSSVTIRLRNGSEVKGRITQAAENMFTLKDKKTGAPRYISYVDVTRVKGQGLSKGAKFGILTAMVSGAVIIGALVGLRDFDPFKNGVLR